jgi:hypothetical protein
MIWLDFETRSRCDLRTSGVYNYAQDASTQVLCMSYAVDDGDVQTWTRGPLPDLTGHIIYAHNAAFERLIFQYVLGHANAAGAVCLYRRASAEQLSARITRRHWPRNEQSNAEGLSRFATHTQNVRASL